MAPPAVESKTVEETGEVKKRGSFPWVLVLVVFVLLQFAAIVGLGWQVLGAPSEIQPPGDGEPVERFRYYREGMQGLLLSYQGPNRPLLVGMDIALKATSDRFDEKIQVLSNARPAIKEKLAFVVMTKEQHELNTPEALAALKTEFLNQVREVLDTVGTREFIVEEVVIEKIIFQAR